MPAGIPDARLLKLISKIPALKDFTHFENLGGGLTNMNYSIETPGGKYVLRLSDTATSLLGIQRTNERLNTERACQAGVGAEVVDALPAENVLVLRWIHGRTLHAPDLQNNASLLLRIAGALEKLHAGPPFEGNFHFPTIRKKYLEIVIQNKYFIPDLYLSLESRIMEMEQCLASDPEEKCPCNNDLLPENFLDDGQKIWIIDYEYAGQNEPSFELGNLASEAGLSEDRLRILCDAYWHAHLPDKIARARAWSIIARYGWVLWASIQEAVSPIAFDFRSWGMQKWNTVLPEITGPSYNQILETLKNSSS